MKKCVAVCVAVCYAVTPVKEEENDMSWACLILSRFAIKERVAELHCVLWYASL